MTTAAKLMVHTAAQPFSCGIPIPAAVADGFLAGARLTDSAGAVHLVQMAPLLPTGANGLRWLELSCAGAAAGSAELTAGSGTEEAPSLVSAVASGRALTAGRLRVVVSTDAAGEPLRLEDQDGQVIGRLSPELVTAGGVVHLEPSTGERTLRVLREGPLRGQVELRGRLQIRQGEPSMQYRLTVEVWQGIEAVRIDFMLTHDVPGCTELVVERASLRGDWQVGGENRRIFMQPNHGPYYKPRMVSNPRAVSLLTDDSCGVVHVSDPQMLLDDAVYAPYLPAPLVQTGEWLALAGRDRTICMQLVDFAATRPNQLRSEGDELSYDLFPRGHGSSWPQGRRKEQTLLLAAGEAGATPKGMLAAMGAMVTEGRAQADAAWLRETEAFDMQTTMPAVKGENVRFSMILSRLCSLKTPSAKWDLGDTIDPGYTRTYPAVPNRLEWLPGATPMQVRFDAAGRSLHGDMVPHLVEPVWTNNEYDILHTIATEVMRSGQNSHAQMLRWASRHVIEIDFCSYHDDRWHHRAQPAHSAHHNTTGAYPSHFWTQGLIQYYALTGDRDAEEVLLALGDKIIEHNHAPELRSWGFDRELGWGLLSLVCLLEVGYEQYRAEADAIVQFLVDFDRAGYQGAVNLSAGRSGRTLERQMIDNGFGYSSMIEAIDRYQKVTGREDVAVWLVTILDQLREEIWNAVDEGEIPGVRSMTPMLMAIGYDRTGNRDFVEAGLVIVENHLDSAAGQDAHGGYVKANAMLYRGFSRFLGCAQQLDQLHPFELEGLKRRRQRK